MSHRGPASLVVATLPTAAPESSRIWKSLDMKPVTCCMTRVLWFRSDCGQLLCSMPPVCVVARQSPTGGGVVGVRAWPARPRSGAPEVGCARGRVRGRVRAGGVGLAEHEAGRGTRWQFCAVPRSRWQSCAVLTPRWQSRAESVPRWQSRAVFGPISSQNCHFAGGTARNCHFAGWDWGCRRRGGNLVRFSARFRPKIATSRAELHRVATSRAETEGARAEVAIWC